MDDSKSNVSGIVTGFFISELTIAFVVLKLCNVIDWSWWWVLAPLWIPLALVVALILIALLIAGLGILCKKVGNSI